MKGLSGYQIRPMTESDCQSAFLLSQLIQWGLTHEDWREGWHYSLNSAFVGTHQHHGIVGVGFGIPFDTKARLANIIVHPFFGKNILSNA